MTVEDPHEALACEFASVVHTNTLDFPMIPNICQDPLGSFVHVGCLLQEGEPRDAGVIVPHDRSMMVACDLQYRRFPPR